MSQRTILFAFLALLTLFAGCGGSSNIFSSPTGGGGVSTSLDPGQQLYGRVEVVPILISSDEEAQKAFLSVRETLEQTGHKVGERGEFIVYPSSPGSAWRITIGGQEIVAGPNGEFSLIVPENPQELGRLRHSFDDGFEPSPFPLTALRQDPDKPGTIAVPMFFRGGCGMSVDDFCGSGAQARYIPPDWDPGSQQDFQFWGVRREPLGTYPPDDEFIEGVPKLSCPDFDGLLSDGTKVRSEEKYPGSTCDLNVLDGACPNENSLSDDEYQAYVDALSRGLSPDQFAFESLIGDKLFLGEVRSDSADALALAHIARESGLLADPDRIFLTPPTATTGKVDYHCIENHRGRMCGMFLAGDVAVQLAGGEIVRADSEGRIKVFPGQEGSFTVHNNGVFGYTLITSNAGFVQLNSQFFEGDSFTRKLKHFEPDPTSPVNEKDFAYIPDQVVEFVVSESAEDGDTQTFQFAVDDKMLTLVFEVQGEVRISPSEAVLGPDDTQLFTAVIPEELRESATYRWSLANATGTLSSASEPEVTYEVSNSVEPPASETISVEVSIDGEVFGVATAQIRISDVKIFISPDSAVLQPGDRQVFSATVEGLTDKIVYQWQSVNAFGALTSPDEETTDYTVFNTVEPPTKDTLRLTVYSEDGDGNRTFQGVEEALIDIEEELQGRVDVTPPSADLYSATDGGETRIFTANVFDVPNGATVTYEWESLNGYGTITDPEERVITYEANAGLQPPLKDELRVTVYTQEGMEARKRFATTTVDVHIDQQIFFVEMGADSWKTDGALYFNGGAMAVYDVAPIPKAIDYRITVVEQSFDAIPSYIGAGSFFRADDPDDLTNGVYRHISGRGSTSSLSAESRDAWVAARLAFYQSQTGRARVVVNFEKLP